MNIERNLLLAVLAVRQGVADRVAVVAAVRAWNSGDQKSLGQVLIEQGSLTREQLDLLEARLAETLRAYAGDQTLMLNQISAADTLLDELRKLCCDGQGPASDVVPVDEMPKDDTPRGVTPLDVTPKDFTPLEMRPREIKPADEAPRDQFATQAYSVSDGSVGLRYRPIRPHARGGLGEVLVAYDEELNREVALKQVQDRFADDQASRARFVLEAEVTGGLEHPGIVPVYGLGAYADGRPYYAMRFIRGLSLKDAVDEFHRADNARRGPGERALEFRKLLSRLIGVCEAIEYAHCRGVIHRDIKPGNIMLGKFGETLVVDWGLAKLTGRPDTHRELDERPLQPESLATSMPTMMGTALGTPQYMSPEQALGRLDLVSGASDVYSLGATLYFVLTGVSPFEDADLVTILQKVQRGQFPPPRSISKSVPRGLEAICLKAMALEIKDRYPSAAALANDLEHWLADEPISALPDSWVRRAARWSRHHRAWALSGAATLLLVAVASTVAMFFVDRERRRADKNADDAIEARGQEAEQRRHAEREARTANALRLASQSRETLRSLPQRGLLLAVESLRATTSHDEPPLAECRQALCDALAAVGGTPLPGHTSPLQTVAMSGDGRWLTTGSEDGTARLWNLSRKNPPSNAVNAAQSDEFHSTILAGHTGAVWVSAFSGDGHWLVTAGQDTAARLWDLTAANPQSDPIVLAGHTAAINAVAFGSDAHWLATASNDKTTRLWNLKSGKPAEMPLVLAGHEADVDALAFSDDGRWLATGGDDHTARLWDLQASEPAERPLVLRGHAQALLALAVSPDSRWLVTASADRTARLWDLSASDIPDSAVTLSGHEDAINAVAISSNSRRLFTASFDGTVRIWPLGRSTVSAAAQTLRGHDAGIFCLAVSHDGRWLASGSADKTARLWDLEAADPGASSIVLRGHEREIRALALRDDGRLLATAGGDTAARIWDFDQHDGPAMPAVIRGHTRTILDLASSADGRWLATASADRTAALFELISGDWPRNRLVLTGHREGVWRVVFDRTGRWLASVSHDATARLWNLSSKDPASVSAELTGHEGPVWTAVFTPDGRRLATGSADHTARLWDTTTNDPSATSIVLRGHDDEVTSLAASSDGHWLFSGGKDATVRRWDLQAAQPADDALVFKGHESEVAQVVVSPDSRWLVAAGHSPVVHVWSSRGEEASQPRALGAHRGDVLAIAISSDGKWLASAGADGLVCLWKIGEEGPVDKPLVLRGHDDAVTTLAFSADNHWLVTGGFDRTSLVCDLRAADPSNNALVLRGLATDVIALTLTPDARWLATAGGDHAVRLWNLRLEELIALARRTSGRELSDDERRQYLIAD